MEKVVIACAVSPQVEGLYSDCFLNSYTQACRHISHTFSWYSNDFAGGGDHWTPSWHNGVRNKLRLALALSQIQAYDIICISDVDMWWTGDPLPYLQSIDSKRLTVTLDNLSGPDGGHRFNTGLIAFRPCPHISTLLHSALDYSIKHNVSDQDAMHALDIDVATLPLEFCNTKTMNLTPKSSHICFHPTVSQPTETMTSEYIKRQRLKDYLGQDI